MNNPNVRTEPEIPTKRMGSQPDIKVYGRGNNSGYIGVLTYYSYTNSGFPPGYQFAGTPEFALTAETLRQIADKIDEADRAVVAGIL